MAPLVEIWYCFM